MSDPNGVLLILGRVLLGGLFVMGGIHHLFGLAGLTEVIARRGVPLPRLVLLLGTALQTVAGALFMAGLQVPLAAAALAIFTVVASVIFLPFWTLQGEARVPVFNAFMSNVAIIGGLATAAAQASLAH